MYPIAKIFRSIQGEGALAGEPMAFVRLAGCSVGCKWCDTDYSLKERLTVEQIVERVRSLGLQRVWITGGEPTDHDLRPLLDALTAGCFWRAVATAGHKPISWGCVDWLSVSPHDPSKWVVLNGHELKIAPALNGFSIADFATKAAQSTFINRYVQPCEGVQSTVKECADFVSANPGWRMGGQLHKVWNLE